MLKLLTSLLNPAKMRIVRASYSSTGDEKKSYENGEEDLLIKSRFINEATGPKILYK